MLNFLRNYARKTFLTPNTIRYRIEYRSIRRAFQEIPKINCLMDAGAGSGQMSLKVYQDGFVNSLIGVEPDPKNFKCLVENYRSCPNSRTIQAGLESIPLKTGEVDGVISTQVFEHIVDHEKAASELARVIRPGGYAVISVPHPPEIFPNEGHVRPGYTESELVALFSPVGFKLLTTEYCLTLPTLNRSIAALRLPLKGKFLPVGWADQESNLSNEERKAAQPYVITCLFARE